MPDGATVEVTHPSGQVGTIPAENVEAALKQGYRLNSHVMMYAPSGQRGLIPKARMAEAARAGYQTTPETGFEAARTAGVDDSTLFQAGVADALLPVGREAETPLQATTAPLRTAVGIGRSLYRGAKAALRTSSALPSTAKVNALSELMYRAASVAGPALGVDPESMEQLGEEAKGPRIAGQAAVPAATAAVLTFARRGASAARNFITDNVLRDAEGNVRSVGEMYKAAVDAGFPESEARKAAREAYDHAKTITEAQEAAAKEAAKRAKADGTYEPFRPRPAREEMRFTPSRGGGGGSSGSQARALPPPPKTSAGAAAATEPSMRDVGPGIRPSTVEARLTELLRKPVLTPAEATELQRAFGNDWRRLRGEGTMDMQARQLGSLRSRRAARGMPEPPQ